MRRVRVGLHAALVLFLAATPVSALADTAPENPSGRNPIVWLIEDIGKVLNGISEGVTSIPNQHGETDKEMAPTTTTLSDHETAAKSVQVTTTATSQPRGFVNPFTAIFKDLAALFGASEIATPENENTQVASTPASTPDDVDVDTIPATAQPAAAAGERRNPITWLLSDLASLFNGSNSVNDGDSEYAAASSDTGATDAPQNIPLAQETTGNRVTDEAVSVEVASVSGNTAPEEHPLARLFATILTALQPQVESTPQPAVQDPVPESYAAAHLSSDTETRKGDAPVEVDRGHVPDDVIVGGPWTQRHRSDIFDPTSKVVTSQPDTLKSYHVADLDKAPETPDIRDETVLATPDTERVIRRRAAPVYEARNHRSLGTGALAPEDTPREESLLANFMDSMFGEDESVETVSKNISDRIIAEERLDLGYVRPDPVTATPAPEKTLIGESVLTEIDLYLGRDTIIGTPYDPAQYSAQSCLERPLHASVFCLTRLNWPASIGASFEQDTAFFEDKEAVARYENGALSRVYTVFDASDFADVVKFMQRRFGAPMEREIVWMHMMEAPELPNTTFRWKAVTEDRRDVIILEVRNYDDLRRSFANTDHGMIRLYREGSRPIFKHLTTMDLMLMQRRRISRAPVDVNAPPPQ